MKIFYKDNKHTGYTESPFDVEIEGGGIIEVDKDSTEADNVRSGKIPVISNGKITGWTDPEKSDVDLALDDLKAAITKTDQQNKLTKLLLLERGVIPKT